MGRRRLPTNEINKLKNLTNKVCVKTAINDRTIKEINHLTALIGKSPPHLTPPLTSPIVVGIVTALTEWQVAVCHKHSVHSVKYLS